MSLLQRLRERVVGGMPSPWDLPLAWGVSAAAFVLVFIFARGRQLDNLPIPGLREQLLLMLFAAGPALLVAAPLAVLLFALAGSAQPRTRRMRRWLIGGAAILLIAGFVAPLALRAAWASEPSWRLENEPLAWLVTELPAAAVSGVPPGAGAGEVHSQHASEIAGRASGWIAALIAWLACWPLVRREPRVHVGWFVALSFGVFGVAAMLARTFVTSRQPSLGVAIVASTLASALPCLLAWRFVAAAGARWPMTPEQARVADERPVGSLGLARTALFTLAALVGWIGFLAVLSPPALRSFVDAMRAPPHVGEMAPDFVLADRDGAPIRLADFRGKPVLVSFGASWCGPCKREFPHLAELAGSGAGIGLEVLWISKDADHVELEEFLSRQPKLPMVARANEDVLLSYDIDGIPSTFLLDATGRIAWRQVGFGPTSLASLREAIAALSL